MLAPVQGWLGFLEAQRGEMPGFLKVQTLNWHSMTSKAFFG